MKKSINLNITKYPLGTQKELFWSSQNNDVCTIQSLNKGSVITLTAVGVGTSQIIATDNANFYSIPFTVNVLEYDNGSKTIIAPEITPVNPDSTIENADITNIIFTNVTTETINLSMDGTDSTPTNPDTSDIDPDIIPTISFVIDTNNSDMSQIDLSLN